MAHVSDSYDEDTDRIESMPEEDERDDEQTIGAFEPWEPALSAPLPPDTIFKDADAVWAYLEKRREAIDRRHEAAERLHHDVSVSMLAMTKASGLDIAHLADADLTPFTTDIMALAAPPTGTGAMAQRPKRRNYEAPSLYDIDCLQDAIAILKWEERWFDAEWLLPDNRLRAFRYRTYYGRLTKRELAGVCAQALIEAGAPVRKHGGKLFFYDGQRWNGDKAEELIAPWIRWAIDRILAQELRPLVDKERGAELMYSWTMGAILLWERWQDVPADAVKAMLTVLPEKGGNIMIQDPESILNTPNGTLWLRPDGGVSLFDDPNTARNLGLTHATARLPEDIPAAWDQSLATLAPAFHRVLTYQISDPETLEWFQRLVYTIVTGRRSDHVFPFFYGKSGTGKTSIANGISMAMGTYAATVENPDKAEEQRAFLAVTKGRRKLSDKVGLRFLPLPECSKEYPYDTAWINQLTGGEFFPGTNDKIQFTMIPTSNHSPKFTDQRGMKRRLRVIPFMNVPPRDETWLKAQIERETSGILIWALRGGKSYAEHARVYGSGLEPVPPLIKRAATIALFGERPLENFVRLLEKSDEYVPFAEIYESCADMCRDAGVEAPSKKALSDALVGAGFAPKTGRARMKTYAVTLPDADDRDRW